MEGPQRVLAAAEVAVTAGEAIGQGLQEEQGAAERALRGVEAEMAWIADLGHEGEVLKRLPAYIQKARTLSGQAKSLKARVERALVRAQRLAASSER